MAHRRTRRLDGFDYRGFHRYFVTICTSNRREWFTDSATVNAVLWHLRQQVAKHKFALLAYCFMPDHVHGLLEALATTSCLTDCIKLWKQQSGYAFRRERQQSLWQDGYDDRILREDDDVLRIAAYILANPLRGGLVTRWEDYPYSGSDVYSKEELGEAIQSLPETQRSAHPRRRP